MRIFFIVILICFHFLPGKGQGNIIKSIPVNLDLGAGGGLDYGYEIAPQEDGYLILNYHQFFPTPYGKDWNGLVKIDFDGHVQWIKDYRQAPFGNYGKTDAYQKMAFIGDTLYLTYQKIAGDYSHPTLMALNRFTGDTLWTKSYDLGPRYEYDKLLLATNHSLYLVLGDQHLYSDNVKLLCIHSSGTVLWEKSLLPQFQRIRSAALLPSSSGGFWFGSAIYDAEDTHQSRACFVRLDSLGNQVWIKELEPEERGEEWLAPKLWECSNGDIVGLSTIDNFDDAFHHQAPPVVQRISPQGEILWKHVFYDWDEQLIYQIREAKNGDLVGVGFSGISEAEGFPPKPIGGGGWIFRFNPEGDLLWERKIVDTLLSPYKGMAFADYIEQADGSFVLTGAIFQEYDSDLLTGVDLNILFMTLSANGCFSPNCKDVTQLITQVKILPNTDPDIEVYPTVFSNYLYLDIPEAIFSRRGQVYLELFDLKGHLVFSNKLTASGIQNAFSLPQLAQGMYLLHLKQGNTSLYRNKIIRQ